MLASARSRPPPPQLPLFRPYLRLLLPFTHHPILPLYLSTPQISTSKHSLLPLFSPLRPLPLLYQNQYPKSSTMATEVSLFLPAAFKCFRIFEGRHAMPFSLSRSCLPHMSAQPLSRSPTWTASTPRDSSSIIHDT